ncbi:GNAT family N-acetyltransferase [Streptomyces sp. NPDC057939]|uniref:GNAT family N-acetyltransferase n=1 Tax=Streptomyces sp. NPDC057939 TaxID=3346284 RepID=UPI0036E9FD8F
MPALRTDRLLLRPWREADLEPWAAMNADPEVREHLGVWRLARSAWGRGYATEAALACLTFGFEELGLTEIVTSTTVNNLRSQAVMRRIGMTRNPADDFADPSVPEGPLRPCVLYRMLRKDAHAQRHAAGPVPRTARRGPRCCSGSC